MLLLFIGFIFFPTAYFATRRLLTQIAPYLSQADHSLIAEKCVSSLQAVMSTVTGFFIVRKCQRNIMYESCTLTNMYAEFGLPYFIYDIVAIYITYNDSIESKEKSYRDETTTSRLVRFLRNNKPMMFHHIVLPVIFYPIILYFRRGLGDFFVGVFYCVEATIPFISFRFILAQLKKKDSAAYIISGLLMIVTFFIFRILVFPYLYWRYAIYAGIDFLEVPFKIPLHCNLGCLTVLILQVYWMYLMIRGAFRVFYKIYHMKTS